MGLAKDIKFLNFEKINQKLKQKKLIIFGAGPACLKLINNIDKQKIKFIVDNNKKLWTTSINKIKICSPKFLNKETLKNNFIIITTTSFADVYDQLKKMKLNREIFISHLLADLINIEKLENFEGKFLISSGLPKSSRKLNGGGLYEISAKKNNVICKKIYSGTVHGILKQKNKFIISDSTNGLIVLDKNYKIQSKTLFNLKTRVHGIAYHKKSKNYFAACSLKDQILIFDKNFKEIGEIIISDKIKNLETPQHHINDILVVDDYLYVSMFSLSGNHKKGIYDGGVLEIDINKKKINSQIFLNLTMPHSIKFFNGNFHVLDSYKGKLFSGNNIIGDFGGFSRGLDYDKGLYFVGQSRNRNFSSLINQKINNSINSGIVIFDSNIKLSKTINLPSTISEIHEVIKI